MKRKIKIDFDHNKLLVCEAMGISEARKCELDKSMNKLLEERDETIRDEAGDVLESKIIEMILDEFDNPTEQIWLIYSLGRGVLVSHSQPNRIVVEGRGGKAA